MDKSLPFEKVQPYSLYTLKPNIIEIPDIIQTPDIIYDMFH